MASNTTRLAIPYPGLSDPAQITVDMGNIATTVDSKVTGFIQQTTQPSNIAGYLWWCTDSTSASYGMNYCDGTNWHRITTDVTFSASTPSGTGNKNQFWINTTTNQISLYDGTTWNAIKVQGSNITGNIDATQINGSLASATLPGGNVTGTNVLPLVALASGNLPTGVKGSKTWAASGTGSSPPSIANITGYNSYIFIASSLITFGSNPGTPQISLSANGVSTVNPVAVTVGTNTNKTTITTMAVGSQFAISSPGTSFTATVDATFPAGTSHAINLIVIGIN